MSTFSPPEAETASEISSLQPFPPQLPRPSIGQRLRKYVWIWRVSLAERLVYRTDFFTSTFLRFLPMLTTILLWHAIFGVDEESRNSKEIAGYHLNDMISYLLLVHISRMFSSMPKLAGGIASDIREGTLKKYLLQPLDMISYLVAYRIAHKMSYMMMSSIPYTILFYLCSDYLPGWPDPWTFVGYVASLLMGFMIGFFFECTIGMIGFWFLEVTSFLYVVGTITFFLSGHMFPLDLLGTYGEFWVYFMRCFPFQYLAYFPAAVFLGKIHGAALVQGLIIEACWVVALIVICQTMYKLGLRRYSAYGG
ncbi:MAG: ABC transporter permease [Gemmataceae bacterium]